MVAMVAARQSAIARARALTLMATTAKAERWHRYREWQVARCSGAMSSREHAPTARRRPLERTEWVPMIPQEEVAERAMAAQRKPRPCSNRLKSHKRDRSHR